MFARLICAMAAVTVLATGAQSQRSHPVRKPTTQTFAPVKRPIFVPPVYHRPPIFFPPAYRPPVFYPPIFFPPVYRPPYFPHYPKFPGYGW